MNRILQLVFILALWGTTAKGQLFTLKSNTLSGQMTSVEEFNGFGCQGKNQSPQLYWENPPEGTRSFAVVMYDKDAPTGSGWWHWLIVDIPADVNELKKGAGSPSLQLAPKGSVQSITDYGVPGFGGPCPPQGHGFHEYKITIYALPDEKLGTNEKTTPAIVGYNLESKALGKASIIGYYKREK